MSFCMPSMFSQVERFLGPSRMDLRISLDRPHGVYTNKDEISGHVILRNETQVDIATITIRFSGSAASRLDAGRLAETHQLFKTSEQLFPPREFASSFNPRAVTVSPGQHTFPFSFRFPHASECYKAGLTNGNGRQSGSRRAHHLLRRLPPSTGDSTTAEEIKYLLEATVHQDGLIRGTHKANREVYFHCISTMHLPLRGITDKRSIICLPDLPEPISPRSQAPICEIEATLLNGPFLVLGQPVPLGVEITNFPGVSADHNVSLDDFQSMLIETTQVRAKGSTESITRSWIIQTMANLRQPLTLYYDDIAEPVLGVNESLWSQHVVPIFLTPTFETCNVSRSFKLEVRLGIRFGQDHIKIFEFQFPVYIVSLSIPGLEVEKQEPAPDYFESMAYEKGLMKETM
ncbi:hypothetical protein BJY01DRAFT_251097 [Aspergillus pseudoustus]|uniref:Arrestin-like N-terminal domain-containing protein n=1 Tax=Aspergillus pseudoustus TaxID=1810923 RepID=A0ABR4JDT7_9EURO